MVKRDDLFIVIGFVGLFGLLRSLDLLTTANVRHHCPGGLEKNTKSPDFSGNARFIGQYAGFVGKTRRGLAGLDL